VDKIHGTVLGLSAGPNLTWNYSDSSSLTLEVMNTFLSFAASIEKLVASSNEVTLGWRTFL